MSQQDMSGAQFGLMNSLKSGNIVFDVFICMLIPMVLPLLMKAGNNSGHLMEFLAKYFGYDYVYRNIEIEEMTNAWRGTIRTGGDKQRNDILQKAITHYLAHNSHIKYSAANVSFSALKKNDDKRNYWEAESETAALAQLKRFSINLLPQRHTWVEIDNDKGIEFRIDHQEEDQGKKDDAAIKTVTTFRFRAKNPKGSETIDEFLDAVYSWYLERVQDNQDDGRYLYVLQKKPKGDVDVTALGAGGGGGGGGRRGKEEGEGAGDVKQVYKRYLLSDEKSFSTLFFKEKKALLDLLSDFREEKGKYMIKGFPKKLGLLLHGPPGTGKTSMIKALAQYMGRSVVTIPLSRIDTNQELMDIVFDQIFPVPGVDIPPKLTYKQVIFVMEDADAASHIVMKRSSVDTRPTPQSGPAGDGEAKEVLTMSPLTSLGVDEVALLLGACDMSAYVQAFKDNALDGKALVELENVGELEELGVKMPKIIFKRFFTALAKYKSDGVSDDVLGVGRAERHFASISTTLPSSLAPSVSSNTSTSVTAAGNSDANSTNAIMQVVLADKVTSKDKEKREAEEKREKDHKADKADLSGLLNVLDGVVDTPGRIFVMTSNHPDKLDPALIRPGRVDKVIYMGYIETPEAIEMVQYYFQVPSLTDAQTLILSDIIERGYTDLELPEPSARSLAKSSVHVERGRNANHWKPGGVQGTFNAADAADEVPQYTPAELEILCAENETVDDFLIALAGVAAELRGRPHVTKPGPARQVSQSFSPRSPLSRSSSTSGKESFARK